MTADTIVRNIGVLATLRGVDGPRTGRSAGQIGLVERAAVAASDGRIAAVGSEPDVLRDVSLVPGAREIDAGGSLVTPGLVDPHTHAVYARTREHEFAMRVAGSSYEEIAEAGGGIRSSVRDLRAASEDDLLTVGRSSLDRALAYGSTTVEVKSGYGLELEAELKTLRAIRTLGAEHAVDVVPTFLGAHEIPDEWRHDADGYVARVTDEMLPRVAEEDLARFCDVFCEAHVFDVAQSRRILEAAKDVGLEPKLHADELAPTGGAELAAEVGAASADHLVCASDEGLRAMGAAGVIAVLLPGTTLSLGKMDYARARFMIEAGVPVALATDMNPGSSMTESMQIVMALGSMTLRMSPEEVLVASTINAAAAVGMERDVGSVENGKLCDLVLWEVDDHRAIPYHYGVNLARTVVKRGVPYDVERASAARRD
ncbi:MAG: imidazolonepropionase [Candidatus Eisenbacteria bacterium]|nr:imidazolonepropionase [Candidatus Eisenbacteria bacterium]